MQRCSYADALEARGIVSSAYAQSDLGIAIGIGGVFSLSLFPVVVIGVQIIVQFFGYCKRGQRGIQVLALSICSVTRIPCHRMVCVGRCADVAPAPRVVVSADLHGIFFEFKETTGIRSFPRCSPIVGEEETEIKQEPQYGSRPSLFAIRH